MPVTVVCQRAMATLRELFGLNDDDSVFVKFFSSAIRGDTPASPEYSTEEDASPLPAPRPCRSLSHASPETHIVRSSEPLRDAIDRSPTDL